MRLFSFFFLLGLLSLNFFKTLDHATAFIMAAGVILFALILVVLFLKSYRCAAFLMTGYFLGFIGMFFAAVSYFQTSQSLYSGIEGKTTSVSGYIVSLPERKANQTRFEFQLLSNHKIRLSWVDAPADLIAGELLKLNVKLKKPHSHLNLNSFDYERWLFQQKIHAVGYVLSKETFQRIEKRSWRYSLHRFRQTVQQAIEKKLDGSSLLGLMEGLTVGVRSHITPEQWQVMQATGTNHLMAISGLHIGFIAGLILFIASWVWRRLSYLSLRIPAPQIAAIAALIAAIMYSALAGFSLPTQRAVMMVTAFLLTICLRKQLPPWQGFCLALLLILVTDPLAILSDSFWLSFGAVAVIFYGMGGRLSTRGLWWKWGRMQWIVSVGLIPLTLLFFGQVSLIGLLANAIAIPWVGFVVLPVALLGSVLLLPLPEIGGFFLQFAEILLGWVWSILEWFAALPHMQWYPIVSSKRWLFVAILGILLLFAPRGTPGRYVGSIAVLPLFLMLPPKPESKELWMTLLDVGQGLSVVIRTQHHVLVYDTGMRYDAEFDMGKAVLLPFLKAEGIKQIDRLVISHGDMDHIGGARSLLAEMPVESIYSSVPEQFLGYHSSLCQTGQQWEWDGIRFEFLYPPKSYIKKRINDDSCVLQITHGQHRILLPGDIERAGEQYLLQHFSPSQLKSDILVVPHHGSRTSSMLEFVKAVNPKYALFAAGYRNRYRHPNLQVVERYKSINSSAYFTFNVGAISFIINDNFKISQPGQYRFDSGYYWNNITTPVIMRSLRWHDNRGRDGFPR